jgi:hypothetical protein
MKKTITSNPLKFFNDAKVAREKSFKKALPKAQNGITMGPMTQQEAAQSAFASSQNNPMTSGEGPRVNSPVSRLGSGPIPAPKDVYKEKFANEQYNSAREKVRDTTRKAYDDAIQKDINRQKTDALNQMYPNFQVDSSGKLMLNSKMKTGGSTKAAKFAALAPPYNKATAADRIAGAKKKAGKK